jgi:hypothetical protein
MKDSARNQQAIPKSYLNGQVISNDAESPEEDDDEEDIHPSFPNEKKVCGPGLSIMPFDRTEYSAA